MTQYASGVQFRAWGGLKALSYGNGLSLANSYNTRLQLRQMEVKGFVSNGSPSLMKIQYQYNSDGTPKYAQNLIDSRFDRAWAYDHVGRLSEAYTGQEADNYAGVSVPFPQTGPYRHTHQYDVWNNLTSRTGRYWSQTSNFTTTYDGQNRRQNWTYDAAGNLLNDTGNQYIYDAAGRNVSAGGVTQAFDGLGQVIKGYDNDHGLVYYLHSTPLGGRVLTVLYGTPGSQVPVGAKIRGYVYAGGVLVAKQGKGGVNYGSSWVEWQHRDDLTGSLSGSYNTTTYNGLFTARQEQDPLGVNVGLNDPLAVPPDPEAGEARLLDVPGFFPDGRCTINGTIAGCLLVGSLLSIGAADIVPEETMRWNFTAKRFEYFRGAAQGHGPGWTSQGHWVEKTTGGYGVAPEDIKDENGNIAVLKGEEMLFINGEDHWHQDTPCQPSWEQLIGPNRNDGLYAQVLAPSRITVTWIPENKETGEEGHFDFRNPQNKSFKGLESALKQNGWGWFYDPEPGHIDMDDYKKYYKGVWFHFNMMQGVSFMRIEDETNRLVYDPHKDTNLPPTKYTIHIEEAAPGRPRHFGNYVASKATKVSNYLFGTRVIETHEFGNLPPCPPWL